MHPHLEAVRAECHRLRAELRSSQGVDVPFREFLRAAANASVGRTDDYGMVWLFWQEDTGARRSEECFFRLNFQYDAGTIEHVTVKDYVPAFNPSVATGPYGAALQHAEVSIPPSPPPPAQASAPPSKLRRRVRAACCFVYVFAVSLWVRWLFRRGDLWEAAETSERAFIVALTAALVAIAIPVARVLDRAEGDQEDAINSKQ